MKATDTLHPLSGRLRLTAYGADGRELWSDEGSNLIVSTGYLAAAEALKGVGGAAIARVAVGTNGVAAKPSDVRITSPVEVGISSLEASAHKLTVRFTVGYTEALGVAIREFGLLTADGRLFARKVRSQPIEKVVNISIWGVWEINI
jgi:hypothetical protein